MVSWKLCAATLQLRKKKNKWVVSRNHLLQTGKEPRAWSPRLGKFTLFLWKILFSEPGREGRGGEGREPGGVLIWYCRVLSVSSLKNNHFLTFLWTVSQANTKRAYWKVDMAFHSLRKGQSCRSAFWQNFPFEFDGEQFLLYLVLRFIIYWVHQCWSKTCQSSIWGD